MNKWDDVLLQKFFNLPLPKYCLGLDGVDLMLDDTESDDAKEFLATRGFNPIYGARPLKRVIRQLVENPLSKLLLAQKFTDGDHIKIDLKDDEIVFEK